MCSKEQSKKNVNNVSAHVPTPALKGASGASSNISSSSSETGAAAGAGKAGKGGGGGLVGKLVSVPLVHVHQQCGVVVAAAVL